MKKVMMLAISILLIVGCQHNEPSSSQNQKQLSATQADAASAKLNKNTEKENNEMEDDTLHLIGRVVYKDLEGGFYGFIAEDGTKYTPSKLPKEYLRNGLVIEIKAKPLLDIMTFTQYGTTIEIIDVKVLDDSGVKSNSIEQ